jgi:polar amino acid transport system substrate-binding protein
MLAIFAWALPARASGYDSLDRVKRAGELTWAGDIQGGEPYVYEDEKDPGKLVGFEVEIAEALARRLGVRARFVQVTWSNLVPALERGDFDVILNGLEATPERRERIRLSRPYYAYGETLAIRRGAPYRSLDALAGHRVGTLNQTYAFELLRARPIDVALYEGVQEPYLDLAQGRLDGVLLEGMIADRYGCNLAEVECLPEDVARGTYVLGLRKGDVSLGEAIDAALADMIATGELRGILTRWKLWNDRQLSLSEPPTNRETEGGPAAAREAPSAPRRLDAAQLALFFEAALVTLGLSVGAFAIAVPLGMLLAVMRLYGRFSRVVAAVYIEVFRGTPVLLQLYVLYFGLAPVIRLSPVVAALLGLGLNYAAYEAEVYRGALLSIPRGQSEAASALGLRRSQTLRHVLLPQALRHALPAVTNDFVALLKDSSLVSVLTVVELTKRMTIAAVEIRSWLLPGLACAALYFAMSFPLARLARALEKRLHHDPHPRFV